MARIPDNISVNIEAELSRSLEDAIRFVIRDELRRLATELSTAAMKDCRLQIPRSLEDRPYSDQIRAQAQIMDRIADVIKTSATASETERL